MSKAQFRQALGQESGLVEWKTGAGGKPIQEAVVAFSNTDGGVIAIGVRDDGEIVGREPTPGLLDDLHRILRDVHDPGRYGIHSVDIDGVAITILAIARRVEGVAQTSDGRVLVAHGTRKDALFGAELQRLLNERSLGQFDRSPVGVSIEQVSEKRLSAICKAYGWTDASEHSTRLEERGLLASNADARELTVAGALCLLDEPHRPIGKAYVEVLRYPRESGSYDKRTRIEGPVDVQVDRATRLVAEELGSELVILGVRRHELPRIPLRVLRETIANAVAHRSYEQSGRAIQITIRPEAVTVASPGGLPEPVTEQNIRDTQSARNSAVLDVLRRLNLAEDAGMGIDVIEDVMRDELLDPPRFRDEGHTVEVTLPVRGAVSPDERAWVHEVESQGVIQPADRILLVHAARGARLTNSKARAFLSTDALAARAALRRLCDAGFLRREGQGSGTIYLLDGSLTPSAARPLTNDELERLVLEMAEDDPWVANGLLRDRFGIDSLEALTVLSRLVGKGLLKRVGERRGTRYVRTQAHLPHSE